MINIDDLGFFETDNIGLSYKSSDDLGIIYTSGTTGEPKGLVFDNTSSLHSFGVHATMGLDASMRLISIYHFSYGNGVLGPFKAWLLGGSYHPINLPKAGIREMINRIKQEKITVYQSPPSLFRNIVKQIKPGELPTLRWIHLGGEPVVAHDLDLFKEKFDPPCKIFNNYGSSEIGSMARNIMDHSTVLTNDIVPLGYKTERMTLIIVDDDGKEVEPGQIGELVVQSRYLKSKYWKNKKLTEEKFQEIAGTEEKMMYTGDLVYQQSDGRYVFAGRKDSL
ncbi:MAG: AMP-binding protein, partial [Anaerolineales bacterium]